MKKQFSLEIKNPCEAKFSEMTPNANGSFCSSCAKNVIDLSTKTNAEVAKFIATSKDTSICARLRTSQLDQVFEHNETSKLHSFKYAAAVAASVLLTTNVSAQEKEPTKVEVDSTKPQRVVVGKVMYREPIRKEISFTITGKLLDSKTNKPVSEKLYPNLMIYINGAKENIKIDTATGKFEVPVILNDNTTEITIYISNEDKNYSNTFKIDLKKMKNNKLNLDILINPSKDLQPYKITGGLGIKTIKQKSNNS